MSDFFVGYLPTPKRLRRFIAAVIGAGLVVAVGAAFAVASIQRSPGETLAKPKQTELEGRLYARPYPHLVLPDGRSALLVRGGKNGSPSVDDQRIGKLFKAKGLLLERDGRLLLETYNLAPSSDAKAGDGTPRPPVRDLGAVTLAGEIVDAKCYYGRMRPGGGKTHRACAQYCIWSGIAPVLVMRSDDGRYDHTILAGLDDEPANEWVIPFVAEAVSVSGQLVEQGSDRVLRITGPEAITRLP